MSCLEAEVAAQGQTQVSPMKKGKPKDPAPVRARAPKGRSKAAAASAKLGPEKKSPGGEQQQKAREAAAIPAAPAPANPQPFPIVGIGASAGGLEALELFLKHVPAKSGMAYVVIQHLDPTHKGAMVELLQRASAIPVVQVTDRQQVEPDCVYVIPPNKDMSLLHGMLHLLPQSSPRGLNLPIDFFFRSLAEDQQERSIGVVLSGMGSDGTLGLRAIKEKAGASFVQSLASAKFNGMPRSAIEAGLADVVVAADELPGRLIAYHRHAPYLARPDATLEEKQLSALEKVFILLRAHTGNDFSLYKRSTIYRRIERRMGLHQIDKIANYVRYLRENTREVELLFKELLIGVTSFFRDPQVWEPLKKDILPELFRSRPNGSTLRAWVPGCSTGEEAYSLAMVLTEVADQMQDVNLSFQIFATDLDRDAIEQARQGVYPANIAADVTPERLRRFFTQDDRGYRVRKEIREAVVFAPQNIIMDPPFTKLDILSCRNLLIYLSPELQKKLIPLFHYALNPGGILFLGTAETVGSYSSLFGALDGKSRLYHRQQGVGTPPVEFPPAFIANPRAVPDAEQAEVVKGPPLNLQLLADRAIVQHFAPAAILTNDKGDILYISGRTGKYLELASGRANFNVFAMAREGLRYELSAAFAAALREDRQVVVRAVKVATNGSSHSVDVSVQKLQEPKDLRGTMMIGIADASTPPADPKGKGRSGMVVSGRQIELERELQHAREEVQTTREEMQTSQEELKSTNEELQSTNEELQSSNEELTTSKEEMQSMNEELQTVNQELNSKVDELSRANNDMKNLLNSTDIATLFLDGELLVRRFTNQTAKLIKLIPADAGRPITDIAMDLDYPELAGDAREVLRTLVFREKEVSARDGHWYMVRVLPYRTLENVIDGVVITFTDTSGSKRLETALREQAEQLRQMAESLPNLVWGCRGDGACDQVGRQWVEYTGVPEGEVLGYGWLNQVHAEDRERVRQAWRDSVRSATPLESEFRIRTKAGQYRWLRTRLVPIRDVKGAVTRWYCNGLDIDDLKRGAQERLSSAARLEGILEGIEDAFLALDDRQHITYLNAAAERMFERKREAVLGRGFVDALPVLSDGGVVAEKLQEATRDRRAVSFRAPFGSARHKTSPSTVRILPHAEGVSMFFQHGAEPERVASADGGEG
jgi:two-component system CheB/CheR fusion protein